MGSKFTLRETRNLNMPADLPAPAHLGEDSCFHKTLVPLQFPPLFYCLLPCALWYNSCRALLPGFLKRLPLHGHLYLSPSIFRENRGRFTVLLLPCLFLLSTLKTWLWLPAYWPVHVSKSATPRRSCGSSFSFMYWHTSYAVPSTTEEWAVSQWWTKTDWNLLLSEWLMLFVQSALNFNFLCQQKATYRKTDIFP